MLLLDLQRCGRGRGAGVYDANIKWGVCICLCVYGLVWFVLLLFYFWLVGFIVCLFLFSLFCSVLEDFLVVFFCFCFCFVLFCLFCLFCFAVFFFFVFFLGGEAVAFFPGVEGWNFKAHHQYHNQVASVNMVVHFILSSAACMKML